MLIDIRNKVIVLQSMQWGMKQPHDLKVTFEQLLRSRKSDIFESEPYSMCREAHHEVLVVECDVYGGRLIATVNVDGYTSEEDAEYYEYSYPLYLQLPDDCSSPVIEDEEIQETYNVELPGDDLIEDDSSISYSDEDLFGEETIRKIRIAREQRGQ